MNPSELLQLSGGYWAACTLHAAVKLDLFTRLSEKPGTAADISGSGLCDQRGLTMLLDALAAIGLLIKNGEIYDVTPSTKKYLSKQSDGYLGHIIMHHHNLMSSWERLDESVQSGTPVRTNSSRTDDETSRENFLMGMFNLASLAAPKVVPAIDLGGRQKLLDLGGGPGTYAIHFCLHNPGLRAVIYDLPTTRRFAEETVLRYGLTERISFSAGDIITDDIGNGYDVVWISQLLHSEGPQEAGIILEKAVRTLLPGGLVIVQEFILDDDRTSPPFPALFSLNMLVGTRRGQSYSQGELAEMMARAGIRNITRHPLALPNGAGIMTGIID
ncbi:MAG: methyltransferase [Deltaproteobacteria bacterium]|nr:methyltransferase [Deltaproteobacteria bacterium]